MLDVTNCGVPATADELLVDCGSAFAKATARQVVESRWRIGESVRYIHACNIGADDYLAKPFEDQELEARIFAALRVKAAHAELRDRNQQLESMLHSVEALASIKCLAINIDAGEGGGCLRNLVAEMRKGELDERTDRFFVVDYEDASRPGNRLSKRSSLLNG